MTKLLRSTFTVICNFLFPEICSTCGNVIYKSSIICIDCSEKIIPIIPREVVVTPSRSINVIAISSYTSVVQKMVMAKHRGDHVTAVQLGHLIWRYTTVPFIACDVVVPVPLHWTRKLWRGYNQSEVISQVIADKRNVSMVHALTRNRRTPLQRNLSYKQRYENVKHAFSLSVDPEHIKGKHILLVDDVMTSGSTLQQAARELMRYKPASVVAVVAVRVV